MRKAYEMSEKSWDMINFSSYAELYSYAKETLKPQDLVFIGVRGYFTPKDGSRRGIRKYRTLTPICKMRELRKNAWPSNNIIVKGTTNTIGAFQSRPIPYTIEQWVLYVRKTNDR